MEICVLTPIKFTVISLKLKTTQEESFLVYGWALGMGLDRIVMTLKDIPDIRYLRSTNPKIAQQIQDLAKYQEVSNQPAIQRDMSYSAPASHAGRY